MNAVAIANNDVAILAWVAEQKIPDCLGFAIYRTDLSSGTTAPPLEGVRTRLDRAARTGGRCCCALYELSDPELLQILIGSPYVHVIRSDAGKDDTTNRPARQSLTESGTDVLSRMMPSGHIG